MDFSAKLEDLKKYLKDGEDAEKGLKILGDLKSGIEDFKNDLQGEVKTANAESKERRLALKESERKLNEALADKDAEIEKLNKKVNDPTVASELETLKGEKAAFEKKWSDIVTERRKTLQTEIEKLADNPKFEKVKNLLKLPKPDKDGKLVFDKLEESEIEHNAAKLAEWKEIGYFEGEAKKNSGFNLMQGTPPAEDLNNLKTRDDIKAHLASAFNKTR